MDLATSTTTGFSPFSYTFSMVNFLSVIELIALSIGDNVVVKEEIYQFMMQLDTNSFTYAIAYIKRKISEFVERLKQEILHNSSSTGAEDYMKLLSNLNVFILLKYPINPDIYRHLVEELFRMYVELKSLSDLPIEALVSLHSQIEFFVSGSKLIIELPTELKESLQELTEHELISNTVAKPMSKQGENSLASFKIIPAPNDFPEVESFKKDALDILKDIESIVYGSMIRTSSFEQYFNITAEFECENLDEFSKEDIFKHICSSEKHKIDRALLKLRDLELKLDQILKELERKGEAYDTEMLPNYIKSVKTHIQQMWEKAIFPHLLFYGNLIFGKIPPGKPQWLYLKN